MVNTQPPSLPLRVYSLARMLIKCDEKTDVQGAVKNIIKASIKKDNKTQC